MANTALYTSWINVFSFGNTPLQQALAKALIAILGFLIIWFILKRILLFIEKKMTAWENGVVLDEQPFKALHKLFLYIMLLVTGLYLIRLFQLQMLESAFFAILIILVATPLMRFVTAVLDILKAHVAAKTETKADDILFDLLLRFSGVFIYATAVVLALDVLGLNVMPFIAGAGVAGIAIGFAAKDTLSNLIAGVLLIIDRPFEIGDRIEVWRAPSGSATWGDVVDIGIRATKIRTTDNIVVIIPNNEIMKRDILNYTLNSERIRVRINLNVAYDTDLEKAKKLICDIAAALDWALATPAPKVVVRKFAESSVELQLRVWISNARKRMDTISIITDKVLATFLKEEIEIPYPRREIIIREEQISRQDRRLENHSVAEAGGMDHQ